MSSCTKCGAQLMVGNSTCTRCGTPVAPEAAAADPPSAYAPPKANLEPPVDASGFDHAQLERLRTGQRLVILAIIISFAMIPFNVTADSSAAPLLIFVSLANLVLIVIGMWRLSRGHGYGALVSVIFCVLSLVPLIGLILMIALMDSPIMRMRPISGTRDSTQKITLTNAP